MSVTVLPGDRLSHVTRRGMLSDPRSRSRMSSASQSEEWLAARRQRTAGLNETPPGGTTVGRGVLRRQTVMEERRRTNVWESPSEMNRLLDQEESDSVRVTCFWNWSKYRAYYKNVTLSCCISFFYSQSYRRLNLMSLVFNIFKCQFLKSVACFAGVGRIVRRAGMWCQSCCVRHGLAGQPFGVGQQQPQQNRLGGDREDGGCGRSLRKTSCAYCVE